MPRSEMSIFLSHLHHFRFFSCRQNQKPRRRCRHAPLSYPHPYHYLHMLLEAVQFSQLLSPELSLPLFFLAPSSLQEETASACSWKWELDHIPSLWESPRSFLLHTKWTASCSQHPQAKPAPSAPVPPVSRLPPAHDTSAPLSGADSGSSLRHLLLSGIFSPLYLRPNITSQMCLASQVILLPCYSYLQFVVIYLCVYELL